MKGVRQTFLDEIKTEEMSVAMQSWITFIGTIGHVARAIVFGLADGSSLKAAYEFDANEAVGLDGALAKILGAELRALAPRRRRRGADRLRRVLGQRGPLPQDLALMRP